MRSAGSAATYGVSLEKSLGYATAIGEVSREQGSVLGNSLKSIYSRLMSIQPAIDAMADIGINIKESSGEMRRAEDVLDDLGAKWRDLSKEQQQNLGLQIAGRFQLSRFLILMGQYDQALKATETATNSVGSGYRENAEYLKSYEAQINMVKNAWTETVLAMRDSGLGDGMLVGLKSGLGFFNMLTTVIDKVGILPAILGTASIALVLFSSKAKDATTALSAGFLTTMKNTPTIARGFVASLTSGTLVLNGITVAGRAATASINLLKGAMSTFLPIATIMTLGAGISYVTSKIVESTQKQKELKKEIEDTFTKGTEAVSTNREEVLKLIDTYDILHARSKRGNLSTEEEEKYLAIQQELAELFPSLIDYVDKKGNAHLKSSESIREEVSAMEELLELKREEIIHNAKDIYSERIKQIEKYQSKVDSMEKELTNRKKTNADWEINYAPKMSEEEANRVRELSKKQINALEIELRIAQGMLANSSKAMSAEVEKVFDAVMETLTSDVSPMIKDEIKGIINAVDFSGMKIEEIEEAQNSLAVFTERLQEAHKAVDSVSYNTIKEELDGYLGTLKDGEKALNISVMTHEELTEAIDVKAESQRLAALIDDNATESAEDHTESLQKQIDKLHELKTASEMVVGTSSALQKEAEDLLFIYENLSSAENLSVSQKQALSVAIDKLSLIYPSLTRNGEINTEMIKKQTEAEKVLLKATDELQKGKLTSEQAMTYNSAMGAKARLDNANKEANALLALMKRYKSMAVEASKIQWDSSESLEAHKMYRETEARYEAMLIPLADLTTEISGYTANLNSSMEASSKSNTSIQESIYTADKFKQALERVNLELEKQNAIQAKFPPHSKEYQSALKKELSLNEQKLKLYKDQAKVLEEQINNGNITQTGITTQDKSSTSKSKQQAENQANIDKAKSDLIQLQNDILSIEATVSDNHSSVVQSEIANYENLISDVDRYLSKSKSILSTLKEESKEYREEIDKQIEQQKYRQELLQQEANFIREQLQNDMLSVKVKDELAVKLSELSIAWWEFQNSIGQLKLDEINSHFAELDSHLSKFSEITSGLNYKLDVQKLVNANDFASLNQILGKVQDNEMRHNNFLKKSIEMLTEQRNNLKANSFEWDAINGKIQQMNNQLRQSNMELMQNSREMMNNSFKEISKKIEKQLFDGKSEQQARDDFEHKLYLQNKYLEGAEKELEIAKLKRFIAKENLELDKDQLSILDSKDKIEKAKLDRLQKQLDIQRLQMRLDNLRNQKTIQQLRQQEDGTWDYEYVADQEAVFDTEQELAEKRLELERWEKDYQNDQERKFLEDRSKYLSRLGDLTQRALEGEFSSVAEFQKAIEELNRDFFSRIDGVEYQNNWRGIFAGISPMINEMSSALSEYLNTLSEMGGMFSSNFDSIEKGLNSLIQIINSKAEEFYKAGNRIGEKYLKGLSENLEKILNDETLSEIEKHEKALNKMGEALLDFSIKGDELGIGFIYDAIQSELGADPLGAVESYLQGKLADFKLSGDNIGTSLVKGMIEGIEPLKEEIESILSNENLELSEKAKLIRDTLSEAFSGNDGFNIIGKEGGRAYIEGLKGELVSGRNDIPNATKGILQSLQEKSRNFESIGDSQGAKYIQSMVESIKSLGNSPEMSDVMDILNNALDFDIGSSLSSSTFLENALQTTVDNLKNYSGQFNDAGNKVANEYANGLLNSFENLKGTLSDKQSSIISTLKSDLVNFTISGNESGQNFVKGLIDGMSSDNLENELADIGTSISSKLQKSLTNLDKMGDPAGAQFVKGLINGIDRIMESDLPNKADAIVGLLNKANEFGTLGSQLGETYVSGLTSGLSGITGKMGDAQSGLAKATTDIISSLNKRSAEFAQSGSLQGVAYTESLISQLEGAKSNVNATTSDILDIIKSAEDFTLDNLLGIESDFSIGVSFDVQEPELPEIADTSSTHTVNLVAPAPFSMPNSSSTHTVNIVTSGSVNIPSSTSGSSTSGSGATKISAFDTGGYTGSFGSNNGKLAMLHEKELVLNKTDTSNILKAVDYTRNMLSNLPSLGSIPKLNNKQGAEVHNHIAKVEFPNVTNSNGIEKAFENLSRKALQFEPK